MTDSVKIDSTYEAFAVGYWMGREIGSDESWVLEAEQRGWDPAGPERAAFKDGYERGVSDYVEFDE